MQLLQITEQILINIAEQAQKGLLSNKITDYLKYPKQNIFFTNNALEKIWALVDNCSKEIGWHGLVKRLNDNNYEVYDIIVYPQVTTAASITCDEKKFNDWMQEYIMKPDDTFEHIRLHGHSHVNMQTNPSAVDTQLQQDTLTKLPENDFYIYIICNKKRNIWCTIYDKQRNVVFEKEDINLITNKFNKWAEEQIEEYLSEPQTIETTKKVTYNYQTTLNNYMKGFLK